MEYELHMKYRELLFTQREVEMFADILESDDIYRKILHFMVIKLHGKENVTVASISENVLANRRVKVQKKKTYQFEIQKAPLDRKATERVIDKLSGMSLVYFENMRPYKLLYLTDRGKMVFQELQKRHNEKRKGGKNG